MRSVLILAFLALAGCGDSAKSTFMPHTAKADEEAKQTRNTERTARAMERIADVLEAMHKEGGAK